MREKDVHNLIEKQNPDAKQQLWDYLQAQIDEATLPRKQVVEAKPKRNWKWAFVAVAILCVVTLSIVLPIVLRDDGPSGGGGDGIRYCTVEQYETAKFGQTIAAYSVSHNKGFLYVDWYDGADEITTVCGYNKKNASDVFYISERIVNGETGEAITVSVTDNKTRVDIFDDYFSECIQCVMIDDIAVNCPFNTLDKTIAMFEYQNNIYYLEYEEGNSLGRLLEIIQDMLE